MAIAPPAERTFTADTYAKLDERVRTVEETAGSDHFIQTEMYRQAFASAYPGDPPEEITERMLSVVKNDSGNRSTLAKAIRQGLAKRELDGDAANDSAFVQDLLSLWRAEDPSGKRWRPVGDTPWLLEVAVAKGWCTQAEAAAQAWAAPEHRLGTMTVYDLDLTAPGPQLVAPFIAPDGATLIYSRGGSGKGITTCFLIMELVRHGKNVLLLDYESHGNEWGWRLTGLGLTPDELQRIHYRSPSDPGWLPDRTSLASVWELVKADCDALHIDVLIIDSYVPATDGGDAMGGAEDAKAYFGALSRIGKPSLTICHVKGDSVRFPDRPFGSVYIHALARETWALEDVTERGEAETDPTLIRVGPSVLRVELRNKKKSHGPRHDQPEFLTFTFEGDDIYVNRDTPTSTSIADRAYDILLNEGAKTVPDVVKAIKEDTGRTVSADVLRQTMQRYPMRFHEATSSRPRLWSARGEPNTRTQQVPAQRSPG